ncbi:MFS transporter [Sphingomonas sp. C3-2]|uniref:MFS transporter n=1 Tax=Sphingomonas sp. C3-2 TaxID=3062169 RepID=UPI00294AFE8F|nr:MFS transporter [Sphingomonas sp. C3-2]WOK36372.1 MFS transporter [Sphingomonas sp. C3-2]
MTAETREESTTAPGSAWAPLSVPIFRSVWIASLASNFGGLIQSVGASWMMTSIAGSADMVALVQASVTLPIMVFALAAGALADNYDRRKVMLAAQGFMLLVSLGLATLALLGWITPWLLLCFTFLIGCGSALNSPAWQASVGDMVPRSHLPGAVALNSMGFNIARSLGPAIGGAIVAAAGAAAAFAVNAVSYLGLIFVLLRWQPPKVERQLPRETLGVAMAAGIRYAAMSPDIRVVLLRSLVFGLGASAVPALMPLIARDLLGGGPLTYGLLLGAFGVGAVGGALCREQIRNRLSNEGIVRYSALGFALAALVAGWSTWLPLTMAVLFIAGIGWVLALSTFNVTVQMSTPRWVVARALSLYQMFAFGGMAVGAWVWGEIAHGTGIWTALAIAAAEMALGSMLGLRFALAQPEKLDLDPLNRWREPRVDFDIQPRSGPVVITVEYRIRREDVVELLCVMAERRRIRRRDGARHWTLSRDLADAEIWAEQFSVPTWLDYVRHNQRITKADAGIGDRIRALHQGPEPPRVRRMIERQTGSLPSGRQPGPREIAEPLTDPNRSS